MLIGNIDLSRLVFPAATSGGFQRPGWTQSLRPRFPWTQTSTLGGLWGGDYAIIPSTV